MMNIKLRPAKLEDLEDINDVIEAAVMTWDIPERVIRLSLSSYRYTALDYKHLNMIVAEYERDNIIGVVAWEQADAKDAPEGKAALLLHGIYVDPTYHHRGIGRQLFQSADQAAQLHQFDGLLVKAQTSAEKFFIAQGMERLAVENVERDYANRFWKKISNE